LTLRPHPDHSRFVAEVQADDLGVVCMVPRCSRMATDRHHIFSRAQLGRPADVVRDLDTEERIPNIAAVCREHHRDLTGRLGGHKASIQYDPVQSIFYWTAGSFRPLDPQPELPRETA
jgi:hypothetical protein